MQKNVEEVRKMHNNLRKLQTAVLLILTRLCLKIYKCLLDGRGNKQEINQTVTIVTVIHYNLRVSDCQICLSGIAF